MGKQSSGSVCWGRARGTGRPVRDTRTPLGSGIPAVEKSVALQWLPRNSNGSCSCVAVEGRAQFVVERRFGLAAGSHTAVAAGGLKKLIYNQINNKQISKKSFFG